MSNPEFIIRRPSPVNRRTVLTHGLAFSAALAMAPKARAAGGVITVAMLGSLSGPRALAAQDALDGASLALKDLGLRMSNQEVQLVVENDRGKPGEAIDLAHRLISNNHPDVVLTSIPASALIHVLPVFAASKVFVLNVGQAPQSLAEAGCDPWLFDLTGEEDAVHEATGAQMTADGIKRLVLVGPGRPQFESALAALRRTFQGEVVATLQVDDGALRYDHELARIQAAKADAVYCLLTGGMSVSFIRSFGELPTRPKLYGQWQSFERAMLPAMGNAAVGAVSVGTWAPDQDTAANHRLISSFDTEYGRLPGVWACHGYDAVMLFDAALKQLQGKLNDLDALRHALRHADFTSPRGPWRFNSNQFPTITYWSRTIVRDAKGRLAYETTGAALRDWRGRAGGCALHADPELPPPPPNGAKKHP